MGGLVFAGELQRKFWSPTFKGFVEIIKKRGVRS